MQWNNNVNIQNTLRDLWPAIPRHYQCYTQACRTVWLNVSTADEPAAYPKHPQICAGRWSTRRPHSTSLSSGCLYGNPCRNRSLQSPGCSRGCLSERVRRWQLWLPICRTTARTTSPGPTTQTDRASSRASFSVDVEHTMPTTTAATHRQCLPADNTKTQKPRGRGACIPTPWKKRIEVSL